MQWQKFAEVRFMFRPAFILYTPLLFAIMIYISLLDNNLVYANCHNYANISIPTISNRLETGYLASNSWHSRAVGFNSVL